MLKAPYLRPYEISAKAGDFRKLYVTPENQIPLNIEHLIENVLKIRIVPLSGLSRVSRRSELAIDAFLSKDRKTIFVDNDQFLSDQGRLRFTFAHELGHWFLHENEYRSIQYNSPDEFIKVQNALNLKDRNNFEIQANIFAAFLLVPLDLLKFHTERYLTRYKIQKLDGRELRLLQNEIAEQLSNVFGVSAQVIYIRLSEERLLDLVLGISK